MEKMSIYDTRKWMKNYRRKNRKRCLEQIFFWNFIRDSKDFTWAKEEEVIQNKTTTTGIGNTFLWPLLCIIFLKLWFILISYGLSLRIFFIAFFSFSIIIASKPEKKPGAFDPCCWFAIQRGKDCYSIGISNCFFYKWIRFVDDKHLKCKFQTFLSKEIVF